MKALNIIGEKYNLLTVIEEVEPYIYESKKGRCVKTRRYKCKCDCGNETVVRQGCLRNGDTKSCGCLHAQLASERKTIHGQSHTHVTKEYRTWQSMKNRCYNPNERSYKDYGAKGIEVCPQWLNDFQQFYEDMGPAPSPQHSIERIDFKSNYEPSNCIWLETKYQAHNRSNNTLNEDLVRYIRQQRDRGVRQCDVARELNLNPSSVGKIYRNEQWMHVR